MNRISKRKLVFVKVCSLSVFSDLQTRKKSKKKKKRRPGEGAYPESAFHQFPFY